MRKRRLTNGERIMIAVLVGTFLMLFVVIGFAACTVASRGSTEPQAPVEIDYEQYRPAWESAMAKAVVETSFPLTPAAIESVTTSGMQSLSATFSGPEITALATMYRYAYEADDGPVTVHSPVIEFPSAGRMRVSLWLRYQNTSYRMIAEADASITTGRVDIEPDGAELIAEGFTITGDRRAQALRIVEDYVEELLRAAPRLTVERAEIVEGAVYIQGACAQKLTHPSP